MMNANTKFDDSKHITATLIKREDITEDLFKFHLRPSEPLVFKPGQFCVVGAGEFERAYSIVSSPDEQDIELFIELVPAPLGHLTPVLHKLQEGDTIALRRKGNGKFVFEPEYRNHIMVATVTGVAPFVSMLRAHAGKDEDYRYVVMLGASYVDEFAYDQELQKLADEHDNIEFIASCSRPDEDRNAGWTGQTGRINSLVEQTLERFAIPPENSIIYACGHPQMIEDIETRYKDSAYAFSHEKFWTPAKK
jgi:ferredoxin--NADP+ reductase